MPKRGSATLTSLCLILLLGAPCANSRGIENGHAREEAKRRSERRCARTSEREVFGFSVTQGLHQHYDWSQLTTVAWNTDPELVALAHSHGARVVLNADYVKDVMFDEAASRDWVKRQLDIAVAKQLDGINFDHEEPMEREEAGNYTRLVQMAADAFHAALPCSQVSVDVAWSPYGIDGRDYDWAGLAAAADLLFVMAYDMQSQVFGKCVASANSPLELVQRAVYQWRRIGVPADKLVLGLPWYTYDYPCEVPQGATAVDPEAEVCLMRVTPFRGVSCSDAAGVQRTYADVMSQLAQGRNSTPVRWDATQHSPYFNYVAKDGSVHQVWFDDPRSLALKYRLAAEAGWRGVGFWNLDTLDYLGSRPGAEEETDAMWRAVRNFTSAAGAVPAS